MEFSFPRYVACNNPEGVMKVLEKFNYPAPQGREELMQAADMLVKEQGEEGVKALMEVHPDLGLMKGKGKGVGNCKDKAGIDRVACELLNGFNQLPSWAQLLAWGVLSYGAFSFFFTRKS